MEFRMCSLLSLSSNWWQSLRPGRERMAGMSLSGKKMLVMRKPQQIHPEILTMLCQPAVDFFQQRAIHMQSSLCFLCFHYTTGTGTPLCVSGEKPRRNVH